MNLVKVKGQVREEVNDHLLDVWKRNLKPVERFFAKIVRKKLLQRCFDSVLSNYLYRL